MVESPQTKITIDDSIRWLHEVCDQGQIVNTREDNDTIGISRVTSHPSPIDGMCGVSLVDRETGKRLAIASFDINREANLMEIMNTPQGAPINSLPHDLRSRFVREGYSFRVNLIDDMVMLARNAVLSGLSAIGAPNHHKVTSGAITLQRGIEIIDRPLTECGFRKTPDNNFLYLFE